jgi:hypothetical protein
MESAPTTSAIPMVQPSEGDINLSDAMVTFTVRLPPKTITALRQAALTRKSSRRKPWSQQDIVIAAVNGWLEANGYL